MKKPSPESGKASSATGSTASPKSKAKSYVVSNPLPPSRMSRCGYPPESRSHSGGHGDLLILAQAAIEARGRGLEAAVRGDE